jgi:hypothetical protein
MPRLIWPKKDAKSAKVVGELTKSYDPAVSEWSNPARSDAGYFAFLKREGKQGN